MPRKKKKKKKKKIAYHLLCFIPLVVLKNINFKIFFFYVSPPVEVFVTVQGLPKKGLILSLLCEQTKQNIHLIFKGFPYFKSINISS